MTGCVRVAIEITDQLDDSPLQPFSGEKLFFCEAAQRPAVKHALTKDIIVSGSTWLSTVHVPIPWLTSFLPVYPFSFDIFLYVSSIHALYVLPPSHMMLINVANKHVITNAWNACININPVLTAKRIFGFSFTVFIPIPK